MLKDLTREDWLGFLNLHEERVPSVLVLRGTRNLRTNYDKYRAYFEDVVEVGSPNALFEDVFIGCRGGIDVGYASIYGAPMASEITHVFAVLGTKLVIQTGVCGALGDGIEAGLTQPLQYALSVGGTPAFRIRPRESRDRSNASNTLRRLHGGYRGIQRLRRPGQPQLAGRRRHGVGDRLIERTHGHADEGRTGAMKTTTQGVGQHAQRQDVRRLRQGTNLVGGEPFAGTDAIDMSVEK